MSQNPRVPPIVSEVIVGGFWLASGIKVAGYTWESVSRSWSALPAPGSKGGTASKTSLPSTIKDVVSNKPADNQQAVDNILNSIGLGGIPKLNHTIAVWVKKNLLSSNAPNRPVGH